MGNTFTISSNQPKKATAPPQPKPKAQYDCYKKRLKVIVNTRAGTQARYLSASQLTNYCHISRSTAYRWISGDDPIPRAMMDLIQIKALGLLPDPAFNGFRVEDGTLWTPDGFHFTTEELEQFRFVCEQNSAYRQIIDHAISLRKRQLTEGIETDSDQAKALPTKTEGMTGEVIDFHAHTLNRNKTRA